MSLKQNIQPDPAFSDFLALSRDICLKPRVTVRAIVNRNPRFYQREIILSSAVLAGLLSWPQGAEWIVLSTLLNLVLFVISLYATAFLIWMTGKPFLKGQARFEELCAALVWAMVPMLFGSMLAFLASLFGAGIGVDILQLLFMLYSVHLMIFTVAEVQRFSLGKSVLNQFLAMVLMLLPLLPFAGALIIALKTMMPLSF